MAFLRKDDLRNVFLPNRAVSGAAANFVVAAWAALFLLVWIRSPFAVLPRPGEVLNALANLWMHEGLSRELFTSMKLYLQALAITTAISLLLSYAVVLPVLRPIAVAVSKGRFLGLTGLTLLFTLMVANGHQLKVSLLVFGMTVFFVTSMASEVLAIPKERLDHARTLRMSEWKVVLEVVVLGTADRAFEVLRQHAAIGWMMLTMVEGISRAEGGIGAMLLNMQKHFLVANVFAIQILILTAGLLQDWLIGVLQRVLCPWSVLAVEKR